MDKSYQTITQCFNALYIIGEAHFDNDQVRISTGTHYALGLDMHTKPILRCGGIGTVSGIERVIYKGNTILQLVQFLELPDICFPLPLFGWPGDEEQIRLIKNYGSSFVLKQRFGKLNKYDLKSVISECRHNDRTLDYLDDVRQ